MFTRGRDPFQALIQNATVSRAAHVAIGLGDSLLHADGRGVVLEPRAKYIDEARQTIVAEYEILPDVGYGLHVCASQVGQGSILDFTVGVLRTTLAMIATRTLSRMHVPSIEGRTCASFVMQLDPRGERIIEWRSIRRAAATPADLLAATAGPSFRPLVSEL